MFKRLFFISYKPKELHNLLSTFVVFLLLLSSAFLLVELGFFYSEELTRMLPGQDWGAKFRGFGLCWAGIILTLLFSNFNLRPIAEKHKKNLDSSLLGINCCSFNQWCLLVYDHMAFLNEMTVLCKKKHSLPSSSINAVEQP